MSGRERVRRTAALAAWAYAVWLLLTWTATAEQLLTGALLALACGVAFAPLGPVVAPWSVLRPGRLAALITLAGACAMRIVRANLSLTRRIWAPSRPLRSGMVIVPSAARRDGELAAVGLLTSLVVENQFIDLDRSRHEMQYHVMALPDGPAREAISGPLERRIRKVAGAQ